jgi:hypothetical protein
VPLANRHLIAAFVLLSPGRVSVLTTAALIADFIGPENMVAADTGADVGGRY